MSESLVSMLSQLKVMESAIDSADEISIEMCDEHFAQLKSVDEKVDRLLAFMDIAKQNAAMYSERSEELKGKSKSWESKYDSLQKYALFLTDKFPDVEWRGTDRTFAKKLNPPSLNCSAKKSFSTSNMIPDELIFSIPEKYRECKVIWMLKSDILKDDLKSGKNFNFAKLDRKEALQIKAKLKGDKA
jgi:hypothetical protein